MDRPLRLIAGNPLDQLARTIEALLVGYVPATVLFWQRSPAVLATLALEPPRFAPALPEATFAAPALR